MLNTVLKKVLAAVCITPPVGFWRLPIHPSRDVRGTFGECRAHCGAAVIISVLVAALAGPVA
jgi:hypothetical protein